ncbi:PBECR2 nuclease fold domain-containing protein [Martelella mediterranea]|uniref:Phage Mu protein F like protein n=1 Tax=Martelella mediterranea DSM 17316 TaxID=1122214 RepID=A0A1U9Z2J4_9HYPH|nr:PBECR2 nuclease fold domain-containing protein [Martelella mediterranea]AQZ51919.1 Phage Mu protein F like protein [Martelella mediterranea DSM 17316]
MADQIPFKEAIEFFTGKVNLPTRRHDDLKHAAHVRGFSVAGVTRDDMLTDFKAAMAKAEAAGTGLKEFRKDFDAIVDRTGWRYNSHGKTEEERRAWRARIIYTTNMRTSYMAGRYKQLTDSDVLKYRPYWKYVHSGALHPRKLHLSWNGLVLAATDPAWRIMFPPNGWGCGCDIEALSERQLKALGKDGPDQAPDLRAYQDADPRTGEPETRYPGIDRGWAYNVGEEWLNGVVPSELHKPLPPFDPATKPDPNLPPLPAATAVPAARLLSEGLSDEDYAARFLREFGIDPGGYGYFRDASGGIVTLSERLFLTRDQSGAITGSKANKFDRGPYMLLLADTIRDPDEIWADWARVASGVVLKRSYLRSFLLPDEKSLFVRFEWSSKGWIATTGFQTNARYIRNFRKGAMLYRRK